MDDSSVDLILEAAVLIDRKTNIKRKEGMLQSRPFNCNLYMLYWCIITAYTGFVTFIVLN